jgi:hypothetical protein
MLKSSMYASIYGKEFINYRKYNSYVKKKMFINTTRRQGQNLIPVVVDSVDQDLSLQLSGSLHQKGSVSHRNIQYGKEYSIDKNTKIADFIILLQGIVPGPFNLKLGLENGTLLTDKNQTLGDVYKNHKNNDDSILYLLLTKETSIFQYILSIIRYLMRTN